MSIRGIVCLGLLDSPSEIVTLGLDPDLSSTAAGCLVTITHSGPHRVTITTPGAHAVTITHSGPHRVTVEDC